MWWIKTSKLDVKSFFPPCLSLNFSGTKTLRSLSEQYEQSDACAAPPALPYDAAFRFRKKLLQGMDVANRRSFFLGIRRVVLLVQVVELVAACCWQAAFPRGGIAGFVFAGSEPSATTSGLGGGDGGGRLGLAMAASLGQAALYTILLVFFGCDRVVLRAVRVTGWEHGAAAAWALTRAFGAVGKLSHLAACTWLAGVAFLCVYFGRQL